jgi:sigma-E factor negative regulatory protein RseA
MKDRISMLMDGELDDRAAAQAMDALAGDREALETWRIYHVISDAMGKGMNALGKSRMLSDGFSARVAAGLAKEPTVLAPGRRGAGEPRRWLALAAGIAAVSLVGWLGFAPQQIAPQQTAVAPIAEAPKGMEVKPTAMVPLPSGAGDYLLAHQGVSPRVSLQGMAPYVRTVSEQLREPRR